MSLSLFEYGADERRIAEAAAYPDLHLARVTGQAQDLLRIAAGGGECFAELSGKLRAAADDPAQRPAVGDFVMADRADGSAGNAVIRAVLPRRSVFERRAPADRGFETQLLAANVDTAFLCMAPGQNFSLSRLERYLSIAWSSGAEPVVVLTKQDTCSDMPALLAEVSAVAAGACVVAVSGATGEGCPALRRWVRPGKTVCFLGSSGVGKSTLINALAGQELLAASAVGRQGKGRHTTTARELIALPDGCILIDTPGMRELGVETADIARTFADIDALAARCRFADCRHEREPGCAVQAALTDGALDARRFESWQKLRRETKYDGMTAKQRESAKQNEMFRAVGGMKKRRRYVEGLEKNQEK